MNLEWWNWVLLIEVVLVVALIIFTTVYAVRARRFDTKKKKGIKK